MNEEALSFLQVTRTKKTLLIPQTQAEQCPQLPTSARTPSQSLQTQGELVTIVHRITLYPEKKNALDLKRLKGYCRIVHLKPI